MADMAGQSDLIRSPDISGFRCLWNLAHNKNAKAAKSIINFIDCIITSIQFSIRVICNHIILSFCGQEINVIFILIAGYSF